MIKKRVDDRFGFPIRRLRFHGFLRCEWKIATTSSPTGWRNAKRHLWKGDFCAGCGGGVEFLPATGWKVSSVFIIGLPRQTPEHIEKTLDLLAQLPLAGCSVSPVIAEEQTPFINHPNGNLELTLNCVAWMRLRSPHWVIPAVSAMSIIDQGGYTRAIQGGANLATINLTPTDTRKNYVIYKQNRLIMDEKRVLNAIDRAGCAPSKTSLCEHLKHPAASNGNKNGSSKPATGRL